MGDQSIYTEVAVELMAEARAAREDAAKSKTPPLMTEQVRRRDALARLTRMSEGEFQEAQKALGDDEILKLVKGRRRRD
jgi:hypothetical protein